MRIRTGEKGKQRHYRRFEKVENKIGKLQSWWEQR